MFFLFGNFEVEVRVGLSDLEMRWCSTEAALVFVANAYRTFPELAGVACSERPPQTLIEHHPQRSKKRPKRDMDQRFLRGSPQGHTRTRSGAKCESGQVLVLVGSVQ
jgi:hypothetical protein